MTLGSGGSPLRSRPIWLRGAQSPAALRVALVLGLLAVYVGLFLFAVEGPGRFALRPLNLGVVVLAGTLFGMWGGIGWGVLLAALNVALYAQAGIFASNPEQLAGNLLSIVAGVAVGGIVGRISELSLQLREEVERRRQAELRKQELTALLVHDLNNPLSAIIGYAELLRTDAGPDERVQGEIASISDAAQRVRRMLLNMLDIGRAEDGQLQLNRKRVDLAALLGDLEAGFARQLSERQLTLEVDGGSAPAPIVDADPELVRRMVVNLVDNAMKYSPRERTIRVELAGDAQNVELRVRDQGPGIPPGQEQRIFEKYARLERDRDTAAHVSRGLGLAFCKLAAKAHGGDIWVEPSQPQGSVFRIRLPRAPAVRS